MVEFINFSEIEPAQGISALLFGAAGTAKTDIAGSAGERSLYIDVGLSSETFHGVSYKERRGPFKGIYTKPTEKGSKKNYIVPDKAAAYDMVCDAIDEALEKFPEKFDTVILDELTGFSRFAMNKAIEINQGMNKSQAQVSSQKWDMVIPGVQDYGAEMSLVKQFLAGTIDLLKSHNKHFLVLAHERYLYETITDKSGKKVETSTISKILPSFTGKKDTDAIPNLFDLVWHTEVVRSGDNQVFRVRTMGDDTLIAKTRYGGIFNTLETNVSWPEVVRRIREGVKKK